MMISVTASAAEVQTIMERHRLGKEFIMAYFEIASRDFTEGTEHDQ